MGVGSVATVYFRIGGVRAVRRGCSELVLPFDDF